VKFAIKNCKNRAKVNKIRKSKKDLCVRFEYSDENSEKP
jgi:hypothetical protein